MTDITSKPFDWNDNLSEEAIEDFEGIQKDLPYCTCQSIGMALAKLELLEKQGCKVMEPIDIGDEVINDYGTKGVVVGIVTEKNKTMLSLLMKNHKVPQLVKASRYETKTGRHFPQIAEVLKQMQEGSGEE